MYRQYKRKIKRNWDRFACFVECSELVELDNLPYSIYKYGFKCSSGLFILIEADRFMRWIVHVFGVFDGFVNDRSLYSVMIGVVSDEWLYRLNDDELVEELFESLVRK